ncbi:hypothetical protein C8J56DRAFT_886846 [Mycena floridula]|nr:hypothetical protein C8J56DRAFT_886846 [Mycena floridula]
MSSGFKLKVHRRELKIQYIGGSGKRIRHHKSLFTDGSGDRADWIVFMEELTLPPLGDKTPRLAPILRILALPHLSHDYQILETFLTMLESRTWSSVNSSLDSESTLEEVSVKLNLDGNPVALERVTRLRCRGLVFRVLDE